MLAAPEALRGYAASTRERLLELALRLDADWPPANAGVRALLDTFPADSSIHRRNALECATRLVRLLVTPPPGSHDWSLTNSSSATKKRSLMR